MREQVQMLTHMLLASLDRWKVWILILIHLFGKWLLEKGGQNKLSSKRNMYLIILQWNVGKANERTNEQTWQPTLTTALLIRR